MFALGELNGKERTYPVHLFMDAANVYVVHVGRWVAALGYPSFVIPRSEFVSAHMAHG